MALVATAVNTSKGVVRRGNLGRAAGSSCLAMIQDADILRAIKRLCRSGAPLNYSAVRRADSRLLGRACRHFGSWDAALRAAGLDDKKIRRCPLWSKKEICVQLRELHAKRLFSDVRALSQKYPALYWACCRYYGGGQAALEAAGIDYERLLDEHPRRWTKTRIMGEIQRRDQEGLTLYLATILRDEPQLKRFCYAVLHQFGTWSRALRAAGVNPNAVRNRERKWPRAKVIEGIRRRHVERKLLNTDRMLREDLALHAAGRRHFGTWRKAVEQAGIDYNQYVRGGLYGWTRAKTQRALWERLVQNRGSRKEVQEQAPSLYRAAMYYFNTWEGAVRKARERR
jgi:hypothetical protein